MKVSFVKILLLISLVFCYVKGFSQLQNGEVFMLSNYMEVGISSCGSFGTYNDITGSHRRTTNNQGLGFVADPDKDGWANGTPNYYGDFFVPGSPVEGWGIQFGTGSAFLNQNSNSTCVITGQNFSYNHSNNIQSAIWKSDAAFKNSKGLEICQTVSFKDGDIAFVVNVNITNTTSNVIPELYYMRNVDPDNDVMLSSGSYSTINLINQQGGNTANPGAVVTAKGTQYQNAFLGLGTLHPDARVAIAKSGIGPGSNLKDLWDGTATNFEYAQNFTSTSDVNISLIFKHTNIQPGQTIRFSYAYVLDLNALNSALQTTTNDIKVFADNQNITANPQVTLQPGGSVNLNIVSDPGYNWQWYPTTGLQGSTGNSQTANPTTTTEYTVIGTLNSGCETRTDTVKIKVDVYNCETSCEKMDFYFPEKICVNEKIKFEKAIAGCTGIPNLVWNFGDGSPISVSSEHIYSLPGQYIVNLIIPASEGCPERKIEKRIVVSPCPEFDCADHHDEDEPDPCAELSADFVVVKSSIKELELKAVPSGGAPSYQYNWTVTGSGTPPTIIQGQGTDTIILQINTVGAPYVVTVTIIDKTGCSITKEYFYAGS